MISVPGCSLSAGRAVSLTGVNAYFLVQAPAGVSPVTLVPQDKERCGSGASHEENVIFIFEDLAPSTIINFSLKIFCAKKELPEGQFLTFRTAPFIALLYDSIVHIQLTVILAVFTDVQDFSRNTGLVVFPLFFHSTDFTFLHDVPSPLAYQNY
ncbi:hypothetical protein [Fictibacillus sp. FJAT-27399]|uniref:hypothetical protein n=1 Tax=Fictibacillus sp. FJAT-27399 TaxID=1729689 RepID=UPI0012E357C4|nr:hypothetical protein [Fictibacillus sp. FJAT-27399]